jgi:hypothetical protein
VDTFQHFHLYALFNDALQAAQHAREVSVLEQRLAWYRDNQSIVDSDKDTLIKQSAHILQLQAELAKLGCGSGLAETDVRRDDCNIHAPLLNGSGDSMTRAGVGDVVQRQQHALLMHQLAVAKRRISQLEKDLAASQHALERRHPDSLANLIRAAKGADGAVGEPANLLHELEIVRSDAQAAAEAHDRQLRALRQQHEQLKAHYAATAGGRSSVHPADNSSNAGRPVPVSQAPLAVSALSASVAKREQALRSRVDSLEQELERVRAFYIAKVKALSAQVKEHGVDAPAPGATRNSRVPLRKTQLSANNSVKSSSFVPSSCLPPSAPDKTLSTAIPLSSTVPVTVPLEASSNTPVHEPRFLQEDVSDVIPLFPSSRVSTVQTSHQIAVLNPTPPIEQHSSVKLQADLDEVAHRLEAAELRIKALVDNNGARVAAVPIPSASGEKGLEISAPRPVKPTDQGSQIPRSDDITRLYAAVDMLEARAEARELELVRAERAVHNVHEGILDVERGRFKEALRVKDSALEKCKHELLRMMTVLKQIQQQ